MTNINRCITNINLSKAEVLFTDFEDEAKGAPYEGRALKMSLSDGVLFFYIGKYTENAESRETKKGKRFLTDTFVYDDNQSIGIEPAQFIEMLSSICYREDILDQQYDVIKSVEENDPDSD